MKSRVVTAILFSLILVVISVFLRITKKHEAATLTVVPGVTITDPIAGKSVSEKALMASTPQPLSPTDELSRNLFADYTTLKSQDQVTPDNISKLADVYSSRILADTNSEKITSADVRVVAETSASLASYNQAMIEIRTRYQAKADALNDGQGYTDVSDPRFGKLMQSLSGLYAAAAQELKALPVPTSLVANHVEIVNNYLSSKSSTLALSKVEEDPMGAFAAIGTQAKNSAEEESLFSNIRLVMIQRGFPTNP